MDLPGHPPYEPVLTTLSGEDNGSKISNVNAQEILPSAGPGITFRKTHMWSSKKQPGGRIVVEIAFPSDVRLTAMMVHSQHSGKYHEAAAVQIETRGKRGGRKVTSQPLDGTDVLVKFPAATARNWRLTFQAGRSQKICLRGLQYFADRQQIFPPRAP